MLGRIGKALASSMRMDDATWARHANPLSVWTRVPLALLLLLAVWSHTRIGWIGSLAFVAVLLLWAFFNPRAFPAPENRDTWSFRGTSGERLWLNRMDQPIPQHQSRVAALLGIASGAFFGLGLIAALIGNLAWTLLGAMCGTICKMWFVDRMVWLYEEMDGSLEPGPPNVRKTNAASVIDEKG